MEAAMKYSLKCLLALGLVISFVSPLGLSAVAQAEHQHSSTINTRKACEFQNAMRKLWEDHITWTRLFLVSATSGLPDKEATTKRLLQNQVDIGNAVKSFYGDAAGDKLTALLKEHIMGAAEVVAAAKAGEASKLEGANKKWYANADEIAAFLSGANPQHWPLQDAKAMMKEHLDLTTSEVVAHLKGDWDADIAAYDKVHAAILRMADMLSSGIINQFPQKFS
jgi:hypothetical protein